MVSQPHPAARAGARVIFEDESWAQGWTQVPNALLHAPGLDPDAKMVLITLMSYAHRPAEEMPDQAEMAAALCRSPRWLWQQLRDLQARNILTIERHGRGFPNTYIITRMSEWVLDSQTCAKQDDSQTGANLDSQPCAKGIRKQVRILSLQKDLKKNEDICADAPPSDAPPAPDSAASSETPGAPPARKLRERACRSPEEEEQRETFLRTFDAAIHSISGAQLPAYRRMALAGIRATSYADMLGCLRAMSTARRFVGNGSINPTVIANNVLTWEDARRPSRWQDVEAWAARKAERQAGR